MADKRFLNKDLHGLVGHLIEECGETCAAAGKFMRWGPTSVNPLLPEHKRETNWEWLAREMKDLRLTLDRLEAEFYRRKNSNDDVWEDWTGIEQAAADMEPA